MNKKALALILAIIIIFSAVLIVVYHPFAPTATIITPPSTITQAQTGAQESSNGQVTGVYWTMTATADFNQPQENGYLLPGGTQAPTTISGIQQEVQTKASVEIDITPEQPYITRDLSDAQATFADQAVSTNGKLDAAGVLSYWNWFTIGGSWYVYTPFQITVLVNGAQVGSVVMDSQGSSVEQTISTSDGDILINNIGGLSGTWTAPDAPSSVCIVNSNYIYDYGVISSLVNDGPSSSVTYGDYWYGSSFNSNNQHTDPVVVIGTGETNLYQPSSYGGWEGSDAGGSVTAITPVISQGQLSSLPSDKQSYLSLEQWLATKAQNYAGNGGVFYPGQQYTSINLQTDPKTGSEEMLMDVPYSAYGNPVFTIEVPAAMANTWVTVLPTSNVQVTAHWDSNGQNQIESETSQTLDVVCTQQSTVTSAARIIVNSTDVRTVVNGQPQGSNSVNLAPGASQTLQFAIGQTGGTTQDKNVVINVYSVDTVTGALHSHCTATITWDPTIGTAEATTLNVYVENNKSAFVPLIQVSIEYPPSGGQTQTLSTNANGLAVFTLTDASGGGYGGQVYVQTGATSQYASVSKTVTVTAGAQNSVYLILGVNNSSSSMNWLTIVLIAVVVALIAVVAGIGYYISKKFGKKR